MADVIRNERFWCRRGTAADWATVNPTLAAGEWGVETDTSKIKMGDGSTAWNSLGYHCAVRLPDPGGDRILFWDDSAGTYAHLDIGTGLAISGGTTLTATGGGGGGGATINPATTWEEYFDLVDSVGNGFDVSASSGGSATFTGMVGHPGVVSITTSTFASTSVVATLETEPASIEPCTPEVPPTTSPTPD